jgi:cytochrome c peroxidase
MIRAPRLVFFAFSLSIACDSGNDESKPAVADAPATKDDAPVPPPKVDEASTADAQAWKWTLPDGIADPPEVPADNPMTAEKVALGHALFMDKRLSGDGSRSCYSCHQNELGNADGRATALGAGDKPLSRNTPTIWNVGYHKALYWDGRAPTLEKQMLGAWGGGNMGAGKDKLAAKAAEIGALPEYAPQFATAFGLAADAPVTPEHVAQAVSAYERTLLCGDGARDEAATRGWDLFRGKASCSTCHAGPALSDDLFHNVGIGFDETGAPREGADLGRGKKTGDAADAHRFRTPTLRNVAKTGPYFHDGSVASLEEAVRFMAGGGNAKAPGLDEKLRNTQLSDAEVADLMAYLESLTCSGTLEVIGDQTVPGIPG